MNSIDSKLTEEETVIYRSKCHWAIVLGPMLVIIIGGLALKSQGLPAMVLIAFGFLWGIFSYISFYRSEIGLTRKRVLIYAGFPTPKFHEIPLSEIVAFDFYQPSLGSMLNFGKIIIVRNRLLHHGETERFSLFTSVKSVLPAYYCTDRHAVTIHLSRCYFGVCARLSSFHRR